MILRQFLQFCVIACSALALHSQTPYKATVAKHLNAITKRDLTALKSTISPSNDLTLIMPNGKCTNSRTEYLKEMESWLSETSWRFTHTVVAEHESPQMGLTTVKVSYDDVDDKNKPFHLDYYLTLVFKKTNNKWYLIHDQNTKIM